MVRGLLLKTRIVCSSLNQHLGSYRDHSEEYLMVSRFDSDLNKLKAFKIIDLKNKFVETYDL